MTKWSGQRWNAHHIRYMAWWDSVANNAIRAAIREREAADGDNVTKVQVSKAEMKTVQPIQSRQKQRFKFQKNTHKAILDVYPASQNQVVAVPQHSSVLRKEEGSVLAKFFTTNAFASLSQDDIRTIREMESVSIKVYTNAMEYGHDFENWDLPLRRSEVDELTISTQRKIIDGNMFRRVSTDESVGTLMGKNNDSLDFLHVVLLNNWLYVIPNYGGTVYAFGMLPKISVCFLREGMFAYPLKDTYGLIDLGGKDEIKLLVDSWREHVLKHEIKEAREAFEYSIFHDSM